MKNRNFIIFNTNELSLIDFNQILETSIDTLRRSVDGTKTFIKWDGEVTPTFVNNLTTKEGHYNEIQILSILDNPEWNVE